MINRNNYLTVRRYLEYRDKVMQNDPKTVHRAWGCCRHVLKWLDEKPLEFSPAMRPTLPEYLLTARDDGKDKQLHPESMGRVMSFCKDLLLFARRENPSQYKTITDAWLETLRVRKSLSFQSRLTYHSFWTLADVRKVIAYKPKENSLSIERDKAALAFLYLSGMRGGAFVTLPVNAVDLTKRKVKQLPELGVQTKNSKAAVTFLLPIDDLFQVVLAWDKKLRAAGNDKRAWYAKINNQGDGFDKSDEVGKYGMTGRRSQLYDGLKLLCKLSGVEFKSPHKVRHGHGVYGVSHAKDMGQLKAFSQNMTHANVGITDGIYGRLLDDTVSDTISGFTE